MVFTYRCGFNLLYVSFYKEAMLELQANFDNAHRITFN